MKKAKSFILTLLVSLLSTVMYAQEFVCSGTVVDEQGEPIIGASVFLKGSKNGVFSDIKKESSGWKTWLREAPSPSRI